MTTQTIPVFSRKLRDITVDAHRAPYARSAMVEARFPAGDATACHAATSLMHELRLSFAGQGMVIPKIELVTACNPSLVSMKVSLPVPGTEFAKLTQSGVEEIAQKNAAVIAYAQGEPASAPSASILDKWVKPGANGRGGR